MSEHRDDTTEPHAVEDLHVDLTVDDACTAEHAGTKFARALAGADLEDFAAAPREQEHLVERAITDAGFSAEQARLAAGPFGAAARDEWQRIADASGGFLWGTA